MRTLILSAALLSLIPFSLHASTQSNSGGLANRVAELEAQVEILAAALQQAQEILQYVRVETEEIRGVTGPHWIIEGVNIHVQSGSGGTHDGCGHRDPSYPNCEILTGLGNLIIGYNEYDSLHPSEVRTGSHNLVVGESHTFSSFGGFVAERANWITGESASVTGGKNNQANGRYSSVSGGHRNVASGAAASVSGGHFNEASGTWSSVSGGDDREARDDFNWAAGDLFEPN